MKLFKVMLLLLTLVGFTACAPRNAIGLADYGGVKQQIEITEEDSGLTTSLVTIKFDGRVIEQSTLKDWTEESRTFGLFAVVRDVNFDGRQLRIRRELRSGVAIATLTYQFFENNKLISAIPIAF